MTIEFFTGLEGCGSDADVEALFSSSKRLGYSSSNGFNGSKAAHMEQSYLSFFRKEVIATKTVAIGFHVKGLGIQGYGSSTSDLVVKFDGPDIKMFNASGGIRFYRDSTEIASCATEIPTTISHIQVKLFSNGSTGTIELKINGTTVLNETSLNTEGSDITEIVWGCADTDPVYYDNIYISDDFEGEIYSVLLSPSADDVVDFTPSAGTDNYAMVDDAEQDGDTTYVQSDIVGNQDLYEYEDLDAGLIPLAVFLVTVARKEGTGGRSLQQRAEQNSTEYDIGPDTILSLTYPNSVENPPIQSIMSTAPDSSAWTRTILNAMKFGFKVSV